MSDRTPEQKYLERGATIGRYVVLNLLGKGGMGEVYAAYDPELDRKIAIKLLRAESQAGVDPSEGRTRLLREAQAIAKLSHTNVVVVFDVGTYDDRVFLAMEFVDGGTLGFWVQARRRTWREVLASYIEAGRGLEAAHTAGIVHRDFKPDNVMVSPEGKVRVMDFGLARVEQTQPQEGQMASRPVAVAAEPVPRPSQPRIVPLAAVAWSEDETDTRNLTAAAPSVAPTTSAGSAFNSELTQAGAIVGTPAYMAPEQFNGGVSDTRSDQFSFCVALYEALFDQRPFEGKNLDDLRTNVTAGHVRNVPAKTKVPAWVRKAVLRGLQARPEDRFPAMGALLGALSRDPARSRRNWALRATAAVVMVGVGFGVYDVSMRGKRLCDNGRSKLESVWTLPQPGIDGTRAIAVKNAFLATGKRYAEDVFATVSASLDRYVTGWSDMYREACEATHVRGEQSAEVLDLRMSCLNDRLSEVRSLVSVFADANDEVLENAPQAVTSLHALEPCADIRSLRAIVKPPDDPKVRRAVQEIRESLADVKALSDAGRHKTAAERIPHLLKSARATTYRPLIAEAALQFGNVQHVAGQWAEAERHHEEAIWLATETHHDLIAVEAAVSLIYEVGWAQSRYSEAERWTRFAEAVLSRLGGGHDQLAAWRLNNFAAVQLLKGEFEAASRMFEASANLKRAALGPDHFDVAISLGNFADALAKMGRLSDAVTQANEALVVLKRALGSYHPWYGIALANRADYLLKLGRTDEAEVSAKEAIGIYERALEPDNPWVAYPLVTLGLISLQRDHSEVAIPLLDRALRIREASDARPDEFGEARFALARALRANKPTESRAIDLALRARTDYSRAAASERELARISAWLKAVQ